MIIKSKSDVWSLPKGSLGLLKDGQEITALQDDDFTASAAELLISEGVTKSYQYQAEVVADAINEFKWGLGQRDYIAVVYYRGKRPGAAEPR